MGALDKKHKKYFKDPRRFADAWNGLVFGGLEVIRWQELSECDSVLTYAQGKGMERIADAIMKKTTDGKILAIMILENQAEKDYGIPVKVNLEEALAYDAQASELKRRNSEIMKALEKPVSPGELLYLFRKTDRLRPVVTLVLYWNDEEWDGANSLDELIDFRGAEELRPLVPRHPVRVIDVARLGDTSHLKTDLRVIIEYFKLKNDKEALRQYCDSCKEAGELDADGMGVLGELIGAKELLKIIENKKKEGKIVKMGNVFTELYEDGRQQGIQQGIQQERRAGFVKSIQSLMETMNLTVSQAMDALKVPEEERDGLNKLLH